MSDDDALPRVLDIISAAVFYIPAVTYCKAFQGRSYLLHFDAQNPFPGPLQGRASHILDVAYLFQNYAQFLTPEQQGVAVSLAKKMIAFVAGEEPWGKYDDKGTALVLTDKEIGEVTFDKYEGRQKVIWEIIQQMGGDKLISVLFGYMANAH